MKEKIIEVVIVEPNRPARIEIIKNELSNLQKIVGGYIDCIRQNGFDIIINDEGKMNGLEPNFMIYGGQDYVAGTAIFVGVDNSEGEFKTLDYKYRIHILDQFNARNKQEETI
jgi:hypothetical protein